MKLKLRRMATGLRALRSDVDKATSGYYQEGGGPSLPHVGSKLT